MHSVGRNVSSSMFRSRIIEGRTCIIVGTYHSTLGAHIPTKSAKDSMFEGLDNADNSEECNDVSDRTGTGNSAFTGVVETGIENGVVDRSGNNDSVAA